MGQLRLPFPAGFRERFPANTQPQPNHAQVLHIQQFEPKLFASDIAQPVAFLHQFSFKRFPEPCPLREGQEWLQIVQWTGQKQLYDAVQYRGVPLLSRGPDGAFRVLRGKE